MDESSFASTTSSFGRRSAAITPNNGADLPGGTVKAITVIVAGSLSFVPPNNADNDPVTYAEVPIGFVPPFQVRRVLSTGTTATVRTIDD